MILSSINTANNDYHTTLSTFIQLYETIVVRIEYVWIDKVMLDK
jgi:hypothetical protein